MNEIKLFNFKNNQVSSLTYKDQIYFFPEEIGSILGFEDLSNSIRTSYGLEDHYDFEVFRGDDLKSIKALIGVGGQGNELISSKLFVTESGLYALIMRSIKPSALEFQKWITREVLPSIRKTGSYSTNDIDNDPLVVMTKDWVSIKREQERQKDQMLKHQQSQIELLTRIVDVEKRSKEIECRTDAVLEQSGFYSILGYCNLVDRKVSIEEAAQLGRKAAKVSKLLGIEIKDTKDPRFGTVHIYHKDVLCQVIK